MNEVINLSNQIRAFTRLPDDCEEREELIATYYEQYLKYKRVQLDEEREIVARSILDERPNFPQGLSDDEKRLLILKHTIAKELSRRPQDNVALAIFVHEWWNLKKKIAILETDRRYPNVTPEVRDACIHVLVQDGDPNP
ncbi:MAG: hypothetical protein ABSE63_00905 [Thermoguttaceae bacterium]|jgi:hypothetical protein